MRHGQLALGDKPSHKPTEAPTSDDKDTSDPIDGRTKDIAVCVAAIIKFFTEDTDVDHVYKGEYLTLVYSEGSVTIADNKKFKAAQATKSKSTTK